MKITDVSLTLFSWDDIPETNYAPHKKFGGSSKLGLLSIVTDEGITGNAFLGSSRQAADIDAPGLDEDDYHVLQLIGCKAYLVDGDEFGEVTEVLNLPGQDVLVIKSESPES